MVRINNAVVHNSKHYDIFHWGISHVTLADKAAMQLTALSVDYEVAGFHC